MTRTGEKILRSAQNDRVGVLGMTGCGGKILRSAQNDMRGAEDDSGGRLRAHRERRQK